MAKTTKSEDGIEPLVEREAATMAGIKNPVEAKKAYVRQALSDLLTAYENLAKKSDERGAVRAAETLRGDARFLREFVLPEFNNAVLSLAFSETAVADALRSRIAPVIDRGIKLKLASNQIAENVSRPFGAVLQMVAEVSYSAGLYAREHTPEVVVLRAIERGEFGEEHA